MSVMSVWGLGPHEWDLGQGEEILMGFGVKSMGFGAFGLQNRSLGFGAMIHAGFGATQIGFGAGRGNTDGIWGFFVFNNVRWGFGVGGFGVKSMGFRAFTLRTSVWDLGP